MNKTALRKLVIELLDDQEGISEAAYVALQEFVFDYEGACDDIFNVVEGANGRYFLPEDHGIVAEVPVAA